MLLMSDVIAVRVPKRLKKELQELNMDYADDVRECLERKVKAEKLKRVMKEIDTFRIELSKKTELQHPPPTLSGKTEIMATEAIVDSSVIVALVTPEKYSEWAAKKLQNYEYFHVLDLNFYEVANAIEHKVPDGLDAKDAALAFKRAEKMMNLYAVHSYPEVITDTLKKA